MYEAGLYRSKDFNPEKSGLRYNLIKSLILAQDERWRHA